MVRDLFCAHEVFPERTFLAAEHDELVVQIRAGNLGSSVSSTKRRQSHAVGRHAEAVRGERMSQSEGPALTSHGPMLPYVNLGAIRPIGIA